MKWPSIDESVYLCSCLLTVACNREVQPYVSFWLFVVGGYISGSGRVRTLNFTVPHGSGWVRRSRVRDGFGLQFKAHADL